MTKRDELIIDAMAKAIWNTRSETEHRRKTSNREATITRWPVPWEALPADTKDSIRYEAIAALEAYKVASKAARAPLTGAMRVDYVKRYRVEHAGSDLKEAVDAVDAGWQPGDARHDR